MISFGLCSRASLRDLVHVDALVVAPHAVGHRLEPFARHVDWRAVAEMAAGGEIEPHEGVAGRHQREEHFRIGRGAGMRLHIGKFAAEQLCYPLDGQVLGDIDELAAAVIALARQAFGIFVGEHGALRFQNGARNDSSPKRSVRFHRAGGQAQGGSPRRFPGRPRPRAPRTKLPHRLKASNSTSPTSRFSWRRERGRRRMARKVRD